MPSTKEIEQFRKYLNRTLREDFLDDLKKEDVVLHSPIEATTAEAAELRNVLAAAAGEEDSSPMPQTLTEEIAPTETFVDEVAAENGASIDVQGEPSPLNPLETEAPTVEPDTFPFSEAEADPEPIPEPEPVAENDSATVDDELASFLNMDWTKDPEPTESIEPAGDDNFDNPVSPDSINLDNLGLSNFDNPDKEDLPTASGEASALETENTINFSENEKESQTETPASFFTSGIDSQTTADGDGWDSDLFTVSEAAEGGEAVSSEGSDDAAADNGDNNILDTSWAPIDLGEVPETFSELTSDDSLELESMPQFANEEADEVPTTFEEKFGEKKKPVKKRKVDYDVSDRDSNIILGYLEEFPRNVKIACQRFITSEESAPEDVIELIELLKAEESIKLIVRFLEEKTGTPISIPRGFEKINGKAYLEKINSPSYIFKTKILPVIVKSVVAALFVLFTIAASVFLFIPAAHGSITYRSGYRAIAAEEYDVSVEKFNSAFRIWPSRGWSYKYAERYIEKRQYVLAEQVYDNLLSDSYRPNDKKGRLDYCRFESEILGNYRKADSIIQPYLDYDRTDADAHLEAARNFLRWSYFDSDRLESARIEIVTAGENSKFNDTVLFEMLHYMVLSDRYDDVCQLWGTYRDKPRKKIDPVIFSKLAGYYIDRGEKENANAVIKRIYKQDEENRDAHFQWARLSRIESEWASMESAANKVLYQLSQLPYLTRDTLSMKILSLNMKAMAEYRKSEFLLTQRDLEEGIGLYENALKRNILEREPCYGELYYHLGNLFYYTAEEYDSAFALFQKAESSLFHNADIVYKKGFIDYKRGDYRSALLEFAKAASVFSSNPNLLYATGNTFFHRSDYFSALAHFYHTADLLEKQKNAIRGYDPNNRIAHYRTVEGLSMIYNNIGATLYGIYRTTGDHSKYVQSLANLQKATEYRDLLFRDRYSMEGLNLEGSISRVNSELLLETNNMKAALYPSTAESVRIYEDLPKDMEVDMFGFN